MGVFAPGDLDAYLADFGRIVSFNGVTVKGILREADTTERADQLKGGEEFSFQMRRSLLTIKTGALDCDVGNELTIDGQGFKVRSIDTFDDGAFTRYTVVAL